MKLTAKQIKNFDEISLDRQSSMETLEIALNFHSNRVNELIKQEKAQWEELFETHNLDRSVKYTVKKIDGCMEIAEKDDD